MDNLKLVNYWINNSSEKWKTAQSLMQAKRYADALFFCHLTLEAKLKAAVTLKTKKHPPLIHDLTKLFFLAKLEPSSEQITSLQEITTFNIRARYDDYKLSFYKKATKKYAEESRISVRAARKEANDALKRLEKGYRLEGKSIKRDELHKR